MKLTAKLYAVILLCAPVVFASGTDHEGTLSQAALGDTQSEEAALCALYDDMPDYAKAYCLFAAYQMEATMGRFYAAGMDEMINHLHLTLAINCAIDEKALALLSDKLPPHFRAFLQKNLSYSKQALYQSNELYLQNPADKSASADIIAQLQQQSEAELANAPAEYQQMHEFTKLWLESLDAKFGINRKVVERASIIIQNSESSNETQAKLLEYTAELIELEFNKLYATLPSYP